MFRPPTPSPIRARAPLRLGLAGGGTDVSPFCDQYGGYVLNATIDRYAYATIEPLAEPMIRFSATDQGDSGEFALDAPLPLDGTLNLHKAVYLAMHELAGNAPRIAVRVTSFTDAPVGSGLGASSTLVVALVRAYAEYLNLALDDYAIARTAFEIERVRCGLAGGRQDQYSATFGGFNFMEFYADDRALINPLRVKDSVISELEASLVLFYTGVSRESARIIADQSSGIASGSAGALDAMQGLKREALTMKECLLKGDFDGIVESMRLGWASKKRSARTVSNEHIDAIYEAVLGAGALAGKVSGAGGGGFMLFFVPLPQRMDVIRTLQRFEGQVSNCHFTSLGCQAWRP